MAKPARRTFSRVIRERRRRLALTQREVARRINASPSYVGHLEAGRRRPPTRIVAQIAKVLGLDGRELYLLAYPSAREMLGQRAQPSAASSWESFCKDEPLRRVHNIAPDEMEILSRVAMLGEVQSPRSFLYVLNAIRLALSRESITATPAARGFVPSPRIPCGKQKPG